VKDDGAGIGRQYFQDLIVGQVFNTEFTRARREKTAGKASVATKPFQGIRIDVDTLVPFDEVLGRLRRQMGNRSVPEVVGLAKQAITQAEFVQKVEELFVGKSGFTLP
jgi:hypothetical protein